MKAFFESTLVLTKFQSEGGVSYTWAAPRSYLTLEEYRWVYSFLLVLLPFLKVGYRSAYFKTAGKLDLGKNY